MAEKTFLGINIIVQMVLACQIYIYLKVNQVPSNDMRIKIYYLCSISSLYTIFHYAILAPDYRAYIFFMNEIFRFSIMYAICYYYCDKSSGLLKFKKQMLKTLKIWGILSISLITVDGLVIIFRIL